MIRHSHNPEAAVGDQVDAHVRGRVDGIHPDGRLLIKYATRNGSHAWLTVDPAADGIGVSVADAQTRES
ncbi:hypothetical protein AB0I72_19505 [Nocardiopsis sp. NPDC049922]|uniref:hypothetical protein n=1 Tax=Nocardiopsis sp. NPDC049922 TaxID=3155157 RepID=UPI0034013E43